MDINVANSSDVVAQVLNFEVDIGMIEEIKHRELTLIPWREDNLVVFSARSTPWRKSPALPIAISNRPAGYWGNRNPALARHLIAPSLD